jgi:hypothetical protein
LLDDEGAVPLAIAISIAAISDLRAAQPVIVIKTKPATTRGLIPERVNAA